MTAEESRPWRGAADVNCEADNSSLGVEDVRVTPLAASAVTGTQLSPRHVAMLERAAIPTEFATASGIRSVATKEDLPDDLAWVAKAGPVEGLLFPWRSPGGHVDYQFRPDEPLLVGEDSEPRKYLQASGVRLLNVLGDPSKATEVWLIEGTKQAFAARGYAPAHVLIVGIPGCWNWAENGLLLPGLAELVERHRCMVWMDADLVTNHNVWRAAEQLGRALKLEGASEVLYVRLPGDGNQGLDDLLAQRTAEKRPRLLTRLSEMADPKLPAAPRAKAVPAADSSARPAIDVTEDRLFVINTTLDALLASWNGWRLFDHGGVIVELRGHQTVVLDRGKFRRVLSQTGRFYRPTERGAKPAWPDTGVIEAVAASADSFDPLERVTRVPFVRNDGTICQTPGYDAISRTVLVLDEDLVDVTVPDDPSGDEIAAARRWLLDELLADFPLNDQASLANVLALILTPFIRNLVPLVPLAVVDGLQMGVGKNLLADCVAIMLTGQNADPLPFPDDDAEQRKVITSTFKTGADLFVFDEAHVVGGTPLARALTATTWSDRILGYSILAQYPNRITWVSLGNQVRIQGDLARRVYRIALHPTAPNPESRAAESFRHPDLRAWTREHRTQLVQSALTLVRAWYASGQPVAPKGVSFGSFEAWDRVVGGILHVADVPGFLENLRDWRGEADFGTAEWEAHLRELRDNFGDRKFATRDVLKALRDDAIIEAPPGLENLNKPDYARELGRAYYGVRDRWFGLLRLTRVGTPGAGGARGRVSYWRVERRAADDGGSVEDAGDDSESDPEPTDQAEGSEGSEGSERSNRVDRSHRRATELSKGAAGSASQSNDPSPPSHPSPPVTNVTPEVVGVNFSGAVTGRMKQLAGNLSRIGVRVDVPLLDARLREDDVERRAHQRVLARELGLPPGSPRPWTTRLGQKAFREIAGDSWPSRPDGAPEITLDVVANALRDTDDARLARVCSSIQRLMQMSPFQVSVQRHLCGDRVHPMYAADTVTGRWTSKNPNIMGVGRRSERLLRDRDLILAEPGSVLVSLDLSGIDARCVAGLSGDSAYAGLFEQDIDVHQEMSLIFFGDRQHREEAKAITHGINYGRGAATIAEQTGLPAAQIEALLAAYFDRYPLVASWQREMRELASDGQPLPTGTGRHVAADPENAYTTSPARAAQACARDLAMTGVLRLADAGLLGHLRLFLHDEVVLSVPRSMASDLTELVRGLLSFTWASPSGLTIPIVAQAADRAGRRWSDLYRSAEAPPALRVSQPHRSDSINRRLPS